MKRLHIIIGILAVCLPAAAQGLTWEEFESIRWNENFLYGEGYAPTLEEADRNALLDLGSKVSIAVHTSFRMEEEQRNSSSGIEYKSSQRNRTSLSSHVTLTNTKRISERVKHRYHVVRWISKDEIKKTLSARKERVLDFERRAVKAELDGRIDDALRFHYWAYLLLLSLDGSVELVNENGDLLLNSIPHRMNEIFDGLIVSAKKDGDSLIIRFSSDEFPVQSLDFFYFDGAQWSNVRSALNGVAKVELAPGALADIVQLRIEYIYKGKAQADSELADMVMNASTPPIKGATKIFRR